MAFGRSVRKAADARELRETKAFYTPHFNIKKAVIGACNEI
mgnify:CR=1 FL=1